MLQNLLSIGLIMKHSNSLAINKYCKTRSVLQIAPTLYNLLRDQYSAAWLLCCYETIIENHKN